MKLQDIFPNRIKKKHGNEGCPSHINTCAGSIAAIGEKNNMKILDILGQSQTKKDKHMLKEKHDASRHRDRDASEIKDPDILELDRIVRSEHFLDCGMTGDELAVANCLVLWATQSGTHYCSSPMIGELVRNLIARASATLIVD